MRWIVAAALLLAAPAAAKTRTVWAGEWEYRFDDRKISKQRVEQLLVFREHGHTIADLIVADEVSTLWLHRSKTDFTKWSEWGAGWVTKAKASVAKKQARIAELEAIEVPVELEPAKSHIVGVMKFFVEREAFGIELLAMDNPQIVTKIVAGLDVTQTCAKQVELLGKTKDRAARIDVIASSIGNCLNNAREDTYPALAWKKFLQRYRIREKQHTELNGP